MQGVDFLTPNRLKGQYMRTYYNSLLKLRKLQAIQAEECRKIMKNIGKEVKITQKKAQKRYI